MLISNEYRFIFFACGKTGTTSIEAALAKYDESESIKEELCEKLRASGLLFNPNAKLSRALKHIRPYVFRQLVSNGLWKDYYKFVFVRNPWDWMVSQYFFNIKAGCLKRYGLLRLSVDDIAQVMARLSRLRTIRYDDWARSGGFQHSYVFDADGSYAVDYVGHYESLDADYQAICRTIGIPPEPLPSLNTTKHRRYQKHYSAAAREAVHEAYWKDVKLLGYEY